MKYKQILNNQMRAGKMSYGELYDNIQIGFIKAKRGDEFVTSDEGRAIMVNGFHLEPVSDSYKAELVTIEKYNTSTKMSFTEKLYCDKSNVRTFDHIEVIKITVD